MRKGLRWLLFPLGAALLLATVAFQEGIALSSQAAQGQQATATFIPSDRLAEPTQPANPSQADQGARDYWLYCMVCHGDFGQGLTDEFRMLYPPEEQYCWQSGCHGERPYENGFTLPTSIPPVIGPEAPLNKFADASVLHVFVSAAMPWHLPGSLEPEVYWRLTAFLLRENGYENPYEELGPENAAFIPLGGPGAALGTEEVAQVTPHATAEEAGQNMQQILTGREDFPVVALAAIAGTVFVVAVLVWSRRKRA
jgi:hypothetical protein